MKKLMEYLEIAIHNVIGQKHKNRRLVLIMVSVVICCVLGKSLILACSESLISLSNRGNGRVLVIDDFDGSLLENIREKVEAIDGVGEVERNMFYLSAEVLNMGELWGSKQIPVTIKSNHKGMNQYRVEEGNQKLSYGEIIIPKYLYGMGDIGLYEHKNGSEYIGKELELRCNQQMNYTFTVVGTYDNLLSEINGSTFFICAEQADEIQGIIYEMEEAKLREEYAELFAENSSIEIAKSPKHYIGIYIEEGYDIDTVCKKIESVTGESTMKLREPSESVLMLYDLIEKIINIFVLMLTVVCFFSTILLLSTELNKRIKETALYVALGYTKKDIIRIFSIEKVILGVKALGYGCVISEVVVLGLNLYMQNFAKFYFRYIVFRVHPEQIVYAGGILFGAAVISLFIIVYKLNKVNVRVNMKALG